ncbi:NAD-dependent epimerase/dehydratase family protein [Streptosporangium saharense]|uniref:UDP-glucose 4-epimerase n=1 Tax=Streptosporangium saharense TaxID=1706840 RepID=A0A7W7QSF3_9ACTN|nr:NAD-dependent epimerase/dehydratase family protein [Streptosporangium saharense]MBB4918925.1 UDP-glucose 4-epimerase [Streptosporangium saharense]
MTYTSLVTGGAGFIGSHVAADLLRAGHRVVVLDDLSGGTAANVPSGAHFHQGDICDPGVVDALFAEWRFDHVFHLAAYAAEGLSHFIKRYNYTNNVVGSVNLINAAVNAGTVRCFVFTSSIAVYGHAEPPMTEDLIPSPVDPYGIAKYAVEQELKVSHEMFGLPYIIFRPHNVYGERQNIGDRYRNVIGIFMNQILRGEECVIFGDGEQTRAFSHIDDVAPPIARSIENPRAYGQTFNIGGDTPYTVNELAEAVATAMGVEPRVRHVEARHEVVHAFSSHDRAREILGVGTTSVPLTDGLTQMATWAKKHGPQEPSIFSGIEISKNMPPSWQSVVASD